MNYSTVLEHIQQKLHIEQLCVKNEFSGSPQHAFIAGKIVAYEEVIALLEKE